MTRETLDPLGRETLIRLVLAQVEAIAALTRKCEALLARVAEREAKPQIACEAYDHIEIPTIKTDVTRVTLFGGSCRCCAKKFKAPPPQDMPRGSPFGENLRRPRSPSALHARRRLRAAGDAAV